MEKEMEKKMKEEKERKSVDSYISLTLSLRKSLPIFRR